MLEAGERSLESGKRSVSWLGSGYPQDPGLVKQTPSPNTVASQRKSAADDARSACFGRLVGCAEVGRLRHENFAVPAPVTAIMHCRRKSLDTPQPSLPVGGRLAHSPCRLPLVVVGRRECPDPLIDL